MIKVELIISGFLGPGETNHQGLETITKEYTQPLTIGEILLDAKIKVNFLGLIVKNGKTIHRDFLIKESCQIKLFPLLGGG